MTFLAFCILATVVLAICLVIAAIANSLDQDDVTFLAVAASVVLLLTCLVSWGSLAAAKNNATLARNYCNSLEARGHEVQFFEYNQFNRECFILVDEQWLKVTKDNFGRRSDG